MERSARAARRSSEIRRCRHFRFSHQQTGESRLVFEQALRRGIQVQTHAIGDRANRMVLDLYAEAFKKVPPNERKVAEPRWRIEHAQILSPQDIPRFAELGVIPSMQPSHAISDFSLRLETGQSARRRVCLEEPAQNGRNYPGRIRCSGRARRTDDRVLSRGHAQEQDAFTGKGWHPEQAVFRAQALKMSPSRRRFPFEEKDKGTIAVGKLAEPTVLSADIMTIPEAEILKRIAS